MYSKALLRSRARKKRIEISIKRQIVVSRNVLDILCKIPSFITSNKVGIYLSFDNEVGLGYIINWLWKNNKICCAPVICPSSNKKLIFVEYNLNTKLKHNKFKIAEPIITKTTPIVKLASIDIILVPLTSFDEKCNRLGMGGGYYDRTLSNIDANNRPLLIGIAYDLQKITIVPTENFDVTLDAVVTENKYYHR